MTRVLPDATVHEIRRPRRSGVVLIAIGVLLWALFGYLLWPGTVQQGGVLITIVFYVLVAGMLALGGYLVLGGAGDLVTDRYVTISYDGIVYENWWLGQFRIAWHDISACQVETRRYGSAGVEIATATFELGSPLRRLRVRAGRIGFLPRRDDRSLTLRTPKKLATTEELADLLRRFSGGKFEPTRSNGGEL